MQAILHCFRYFAFHGWTTMATEIFSELFRHFIVKHGLSVDFVLYFIKDVGKWNVVLCILGRKLNIVRILEGIFKTVWKT